MLPAFDSYTTQIARADSHSKLKEILDDFRGLYENYMYKNMLDAADDDSQKAYADGMVDLTSQAVKHWLAVTEPGMERYVRDAPLADLLTTIEHTLPEQLDMQDTVIFPLIQDLGSNRKFLTALQTDVPHSSFLLDEFRTYIDWQSLDANIGNNIVQGMLKQYINGLADYYNKPGYYADDVDNVIRPVNEMNDFLDTDDTALLAAYARSNARLLPRILSGETAPGKEDSDPAVAFRNVAESGKAHTEALPHMDEAEIVARVVESARDLLPFANSEDLPEIIGNHLFVIEYACKIPGIYITPEQLTTVQEAINARKPDMPNISDPEYALDEAKRLFRQNMARNSQHHHP